MTLRLIQSNSQKPQPSALPADFDERVREMARHVRIKQALALAIELIDSLPKRGGFRYNRGEMARLLHEHCGRAKAGSARELAREFLADRGLVPKPKRNTIARDKVDPISG
jgi:hypothetical protein